MLPASAGFFSSLTGEVWTCGLGLMYQAGRAIGKSGVRQFFKDYVWAPIVISFQINFWALSIYYRNNFIN